MHRTFTTPVGAVTVHVIGGRGQTICQVVDPTGATLIDPAHTWAGGDYPEKGTFDPGYPAYDRQVTTSRLYLAAALAHLAGMDHVDGRCLTWDRCAPSPAFTVKAILGAWLRDHGAPIVPGAAVVITVVVDPASTVVPPKTWVDPATALEGPRKAGRATVRRNGPDLAAIAARSVLAAIEASTEAPATVTPEAPTVTPEAPTVTPEAPATPDGAVVAEALTEALTEAPTAPAAGKVHKCQTDGCGLVFASRSALTAHRAECGVVVR